MAKFHSHTQLSRCYFVATLLLASIYPSVTSFGYDSNQLYQINQEISQVDFDKVKFALSPYAGSFDIRNVRGFVRENLIILRVIKGNLCEQDFCLTIITTNCQRPECPSTAILAPDKFRIRLQMVRRLGELLQFPTRLEDNFTAVLVNDRYVAATQGL